jgi:hypothetical protein
MESITIWTGDIHKSQITHRQLRRERPACNREWSRRQWKWWSRKWVFNRLRGGGGGGGGRICGWLF